MSLTVNIYGGTACMETEYGTSPVGATCHLPLNKIVWGDDNVSYKVNETYPLPVQIMEVTGEALVVSGNLGASGSFPVVNPTISGATTAPFIQYLAVAGSTTGAAVSVTGSVRLYEDIGISGIVSVTGGRILNKNTDSITVYGNVGLSGDLGLNAGSDSISVYGWDGGPRVHTSIFGADGTTIGNSGGALNVNLVNAGITFSATIASTIGITNSDWGSVPDKDSAIRIQGITGGEPIAVKGRNGEAIEVTNSPTTAISVTGGFYTDGSQKTTVTEINKPSSIISGFITAGTTTGVQLPSNSLKTGITIKSSPSNVNFIYVGNSGLSAGVTGNGYLLESGESVFIECNNSNLIWVVGNSSDKRKVTYIGS